MDDRLSKLERDLTDPNKDFTPRPRTNLTDHTAPKPESREWKHPEPIRPTPAKQKSLLDKLFFVAIGFFVLAGAIALAAWMFDFTSVSSQKIDIEITGETDLEAGKESQIRIELKNRNDVDIENARLMISYPAGTQGEEDGEIREHLRERRDIGVIKEGKTTSEEFTFIPFGQEGEDKEIEVQLEYHIPGSSVAFAVEEIFKYTIESSPLTFNVEFPTKISTGTEFSFDVSFVSTSEQTLNNVSLIAEYPSGFTYTNSSVEPYSDDHVWRFDSLRPRERKSVRMSGVFSGNVGEVKIFKFTVGVADSDNPRRITSVLAVEVREVRLSEPPVSIKISVPSSRVQNGVIQGTGPLPVTLYWENNTTRPVSNAEIVLDLEGNGFDPESIETDGRYSLSETLVRWGANEEPELLQIPGNSSGSVDVRLDLTPRASQGEPPLTFDASISGNVAGGGTQILARDIQSFFFAAQTGLDVATRRSGGGMSTEGPYPPRIGARSTFILEFSPSNSAAELANTRMSATLPTYVEWLNETNVSTGNVSFNPLTRTITWNIGTLAPGSGSIVPAPTLFVKIAFTPDIQDRNQTPLLASGIELVGTEERSDREVVIRADSLTTNADDMSEYGTVYN